MKHAQAESLSGAARLSDRTVRAIGLLFRASAAIFNVDLQKVTSRNWCTQLGPAGYQSEGVPNVYRFRPRRFQFTQTA